MRSLHHLFGILFAMLLVGCTLQQRTLMPGVYVDRVHKLTVQNDIGEAESSLDDQEPWVAPIPDPMLEERPRPEAVLLGAEAMVPMRHELLTLTPLEPQPARVSPAKAEMKINVARENTIDLDRETELSLVLLGAALLMWGYAPFSIIGYLIVFVASVLGAPLVHALIWGEKMNWGKTRLGRVAISLAISGLVLTGAMALVADILGLVF